MWQKKGSQRRDGIAQRKRKDLRARIDDNVHQNVSEMSGPAEIRSNARNFHFKIGSKVSEVSIQHYKPYHSFTSNFTSMCNPHSNQPESKKKAWHPDDQVEPAPSSPNSSELYRPAILETIEEKIKELDSDLRALSLDIHCMTLANNVA